MLQHQEGKVQDKKRAYHDEQDVWLLSTERYGGEHAYGKGVERRHDQTLGSKDVFKRKVKSSLAAFGVCVAMVALCEAFLAFRTLKWPFAGVGPDMPRQVSILLESFSAIITLKWPLFCVDPNMLRQILLLLERLTAITTLKWPFSSMDSNVSRQMTIVIR